MGPRDSDIELRRASTRQLARFMARKSARRARSRPIWSSAKLLSAAAARALGRHPRASPRAPRQPVRLAPVATKRSMTRTARALSKSSTSAGEPQPERAARDGGWYCRPRVQNLLVPPALSLVYAVTRRGYSSVWYLARMLLREERGRGQPACSSQGLRHEASGRPWERAEVHRPPTLRSQVRQKERAATHSFHCLPWLWLSHHAEVALSKVRPNAKAPVGVRSRRRVSVRVGACEWERASAQTGRIGRIGSRREEEVVEKEEVRREERVGGDGSRRGGECAMGQPDAL